MHCYPLPSSGVSDACQNIEKRHRLGRAFVSHPCSANQSGFIYAAVLEVRDLLEFNGKEYLTAPPKDESGNTALHLAASMGHLEVVEVRAQLPELLFKA